MIQIRMNPARVQPICGAGKHVLALVALLLLATVARAQGAYQLA
jgi:hypothetical protein